MEVCRLEAAALQVLLPVRQVEGEVELVVRQTLVWDQVHLQERPDLVLVEVKPPLFVLPEAVKSGYLP